MPNNQSYIDGKWISGSGKSFQNINPSDTQDIVGEYQECNSDEFDLAVQAAKKSSNRMGQCWNRKKINYFNKNWR